MATTASDLVEKVRSMLWGGAGDTLNALAADYTAGSGTLSLQIPNRAVGSGNLISVGLNTFYVVANADGTSLSVLPAADGGPDQDIVAGTIARIKPRSTTWSIFREIHDAIVDMGSPRTGLFQALSFEAVAQQDPTRMYALPTGWWDDALGPQRLVRARWRPRGINTWETLHSAEYLVERYAVRVAREPIEAAQYQFTFAFPFYAPQALTDEMDDLGLTEKSQQDIPPLRAAARLSLGVEGRRVQPFSQGDARRAEEVPITASLSVAREFNREYREAVMAERSRLQSLWSFTRPLGDMP